MRNASNIQPCVASCPSPFSKKVYVGPSESRSFLSGFLRFHFSGFIPSHFFCALYSTLGIALS